MRRLQLSAHLSPESLDVISPVSVEGSGEGVVDDAERPPSLSMKLDAGEPCILRVFWGVPRGVKRILNFLQNFADFVC